MDHSTALTNIRSQGDAFEREMFKDEEFANQFFEYPRIWAEYVGSRRDPVQPLLKSKWQKFSEHNYTAIVRCWNAREALQTLDNSCAEYFSTGSTNAALSCQAHMVSLIALAQSAAENLHKAFESEPALDPQAYVDKLGDRHTIGSLAWVLISRNHFIHDALTPLHEDKGVLHIDVSVLTMRDPRWSQPKSVEDATKLFSQVWNEFARCMNGAWAALYSTIRTKVTPSDLIVRVNLISGFSGFSVSASTASGMCNSSTSGAPVNLQQPGNTPET